MRRALPVAAGFALRLALGWLVDAPPTWDGALYERGAQSLASGLGYSCFMFGPGADPRVATAYYPVGFPAYLAGFYALLGVGSLARLLAGALAGAAAVAMSERLASRVVDPRSARVVAWVVALAPGAALFASAPMTETLWGAQLAASVLAVTSTRGSSRARWVASGALLAAASFVRPQALILAPLLPLVPSGDARTRAARAAATCLVVALLVAPWALRNCARLDGCAAISTNGAGNFAIGAAPRADGRYLALTARDGCGGVVGELARARCWSDTSRRWVARDPRRWLRLVEPKVWHTWGYEAFPAGYLRAARPDALSDAGEARLRALLTAHWGALLALLIASLLPTHPRRPLGATGRAALVTLAAITATHAAFFGGDRYHLPLLALVAPLAARAFDGVAPWRRRRWRWVESSVDGSARTLELHGSERGEA
ncbi:MAG: hypothetical protein R3A48_09625 [Polyangiales bacterium]